MLGLTSRCTIAGAVGVGETREDLVIRSSATPGGARRRPAVLQQVAVGHQLGDQVEAAVELAVVVDRDHVRAVDARQGERLALEAGPVVVVLGQLRR